MWRRPSTVTPSSRPWSSAPGLAWLLVVSSVDPERGVHLSPAGEAQEIVRRWLDDVATSVALELIALQDPDLANQ